MPTRQERLKDPWIDYGYGVTLFVPRTSRVRMGANPVQEMRYSAKCIYEHQGGGPRWVNLEGKLIGKDELYDLIGDDLALVRKEYFGEWMKRVVAKVRHLKRTAPGRVPFEWLAIGDRFKYCGSWGTKQGRYCAEQDDFSGLRDFELDDMVWRPEA